MMTNHSFRVGLAAGLMLWVGMTASLQAAVRSNFTVVAINGDAAPGTAGAQFAEFATPCVINNRGEVAFKARLKWVTGSIDTTNDEGIWAGRPGALQLVARERGQVPGLETGVAFKFFNTLRLTEGGFVVLAASLQGTNVNLTNDACFLAGWPGAMKVIAREGDPAPGTAGETIDFFGNLSLLDARPLVSSRPDEVVFRASLATTNLNANTGIYAGNTNDLWLLAKQGSQVPGLPQGAKFKTLLWSTPKINPAGHIVFGAGMEGNGISAFQNDEALFAGTTNAIGIGVRRGDPVGVLPGLTFYSFANASLNSQGQLCLVTWLSNAAVTNDTAIMAGPPGAFSLLAREGSQVPGFPAGTRFKDLWLCAPVWNQNGHAAFVADIEGPGINSTNDTAVWIATTNIIRLLCRPGDPAPGMPEGVIFHTTFSGTFDIPVLNDQGNLAFSAMLEGPGIGLTNNEALFVGPPHFVQPILQRNDIIQLTPTDSRTVFTFSLVDGGAGSEPSGGQDGRSRCLNDHNQLIFTVTFKAGQGSAVLIESNVEDPDRNRLPEILQRGMGIVDEGNTELPQWSVTNGQLRLVYQVNTNEPLAEVIIQQRASLMEGWMEVNPTNLVILETSGHTQQRALNIPIGPESAKFFQIGVRSKLWQNP